MDTDIIIDGTKILFWSFNFMFCSLSLERFGIEYFYSNDQFS